MKMEAVEVLDFLEALEEVYKKEKRQKITEKRIFFWKNSLFMNFCLFSFSKDVFSVFSCRKHENLSSGSNRIFRSL